jgi:WD40 repeat protein
VLASYPAHHSDWLAEREHHDIKRFLTKRQRRSWPLRRTRPEAALQRQWREDGRSQFSLQAAIYDEGTISIWKELNCLNVFSKEKKITCSCAADISVEKKNKTAKNMSLFFIGSESGSVWYANESKCDELCKLSCAVISIMFYQQNQSLVLITENFDMRLARLTSNMTAPEKKVRLALTVDARYVKICWMDPCSFGISSWDNIIRIWNLKDDSNYSLNLSDLNRENGGGVAFIMGTIDS